jgi:cobalt-zinc-cadmium efflux system membrane fusion protein
MNVMSTLKVCSTVCAVLVLAVAGCNKSTEKSKPAAPAAQTSNAEREHGEWWCNEHGVPEEVCAQCKTELVAEFKTKEDWCRDHERPDSQCFVCHPEHAKTFAALYEAKYGHAPPPRSDEPTN